MIEPGRILGWRRSTQAFPSVEPDVMMITAGGNKCRLRSVTLHQFKPEHPAVKGKRPLDIRHLQVDMADANARIDWRFHVSGAVSLCETRDEASLQSHVAP